MNEAIEIKLSDDDHGCARCGLVEVHGQAVTLVLAEDGYYRGCFLCSDCAR